MRERPIAFSTPMMRAYLEGRKTETRRLLGGELPSCPDHGPNCSDLRFERCQWVNEDVWTDGWTGYRRCPYGRPGDRLRIKEDLRVNGTGTVAVYAAGGLPVMVDGESLDWKWKHSRLPARFMPTVACRARPLVLEVRVERLQEISEADYFAEGLRMPPIEETVGGGGCRMIDVAGWWKTSFGELWDSINGNRATWKSNPWVFVIKFEQATVRKEVS